MIANAARLLVSVGAGLAAVHWLGLGAIGLFLAIACGFCVYAALTARAVIRISTSGNAIDPVSKDRTEPSLIPADSVDPA